VIVPPKPNVTLPYVPSDRWFSLDIDFALISDNLIETAIYQFEVERSITVVTIEGSSALKFVGQGKGRESRITSVFG
jgi:hypothetical protein